MINWRLRLTLSLNALDKLDMSAHACDRVLRVGCLIAYLDNYHSVLSRHLACHPSCGKSNNRCRKRERRQYDTSKRLTVTSLLEEKVIESVVEISAEFEAGFRKDSGKFEACAGAHPLAGLIPLGDT